MRIDRNLTSPLMPGKKLPKIRFLSWVILCALAVFFSEVASGRTPAVFVNIFGLFVTTPLYFLQLMVLVPLVFRTGKPGWNTLYLAGALFGLYEAYITKMIWSPADYPVDLYAGGIAICSTLMLVLFWHPIMSWLLPLFTAGGLLNVNRSLRIKIPPILLKRVTKPAFALVILGGVLGLVHGASVAEPLPALFSAITSTGVIWLLLALWKRLTGNSIFSLSQLMPSMRQWKIFAFLLAADYLVLGFAFRQDAFPPLAGHITAVVMYLVIGGLLFLSHRADKRATFIPENAETTPLEFKISSGNWLVFSGGFVLLSLLAGILPDWARDGIHYITWGLGITAGLAVFIWTAFRTIKRLEIRIKLSRIKELLTTRKVKMNLGEQFNYAKAIRQARMPKIYFDLKTLLKKIFSLGKNARMPRA